MDFEGDEAMRKREKIKRVRELRDIGRELWAVATGATQGGEQMTRKAYMDYHLSVYKFLDGRDACAASAEYTRSASSSNPASPVQTFYSKANGDVEDMHSIEEMLDAYESAIADWENDTAGQEVDGKTDQVTMPFEAFYDSLYELVDLHTTTIKASDYVTFMRELADGITVERRASGGDGDEKGACHVWKYNWMAGAGASEDQFHKLITAIKNKAMSMLSRQWGAAARKDNKSIEQASKEWQNAYSEAAESLSSKRCAKSSA